MIKFLSNALEGIPHGIVGKNHKDMGAFFSLAYVINIIFKQISDPFLKKNDDSSERTAFYQTVKALRVCASGYLSYQLMIHFFKSAITSSEVARALPFMGALLIVLKHAP